MPSVTTDTVIRHMDVDTNSMGPNEIQSDICKMMKRHAYTLDHHGAHNAANYLKKWALEILLQ